MELAPKNTELLLLLIFVKRDGIKDFQGTKKTFD